MELSPDKVSFTIDGSTEDKTKTPVAKAKLDLGSHTKVDSPTTNANPDSSLTFVGTQDTPVIKSSISCDEKKNLTPLITCN